MGSSPSHWVWTKGLGMGTGNFEAMSQDHLRTTSLQSFRSYDQEKGPCWAVQQDWI